MGTIQRARDHLVTHNSSGKFCGHKKSNARSMLMAKSETNLTPRHMRATAKSVNTGNFLIEISIKEESSLNKWTILVMIMPFI